MKVTPIAHTLIDWDNIYNLEAVDGTAFQDAVNEMTVNDADHLAEFAGRSCYKAYNRERPETATTEGYLSNILDQGHYSVLEHSSVTFHVSGVSRSLLVELERHRFLSFSVESQRYVDQAKSHPGPVVPPALEKGPAIVWADLQTHYAESLDRYETAIGILEASGVTGKAAREAARAFLLNATPVDMVVTGNLRCWRDVIAKRFHVAADAEIRQFATLVLGHLRKIAPLSIQDIPVTPYQ